MALSHLRGCRAAAVCDCFSCRPAPTCITRYDNAPSGAQSVRDEMRVCKQLFVWVQMNDKIAAHTNLRRFSTSSISCHEESSAFKRTCTMGTCLCRTTGFSTIPQKTIVTHFDIVLHRKDRWKGHLVDDTRLRYLHLSAQWDPIAGAQRTRHPADLRARTCLCTTRGTSPTLSKLSTREPLDNWLLSVDLGNLPLLHQAHVSGLSICCSRN